LSDEEKLISGGLTGSPLFKKASKTGIATETSRKKWLYFSKKCGHAFRFGEERLFDNSRNLPNHPQKQCTAA
jgi:hypothetical protein